MKILVKKLGVTLLIFTFAISTQVVLASNSVTTVKKVPFKYNIVPETANYSPIDTNSQKQLSFQLFDTSDEIFYNEEKLIIHNQSFSIDVSKLSGKQTITFKNANNETSSFTYYFADKKGKLEGYELVKGEKLNMYITTYRDMKIIYTDKESRSLSKVKNYLKQLPVEMISNVKMIQLIPFDNTSNIAGTTKEQTVVLYRFSKYSATTQKNILYHEIAHTFANKMMEKKLLDYSYSQYQPYALKDTKAVSHYASDFVEEKGKFSEDFADSVAFYFINTKSFQKNYPNRFEFIKELLEKNNEME